MKSNTILYIVIIALVVVGGGLFLFLSNEGTQKETGVSQPTTTSKTMVDCSTTSDPSCFLTRMNGCLPVTTNMTGSDGKTEIAITILGIENDKCHFQRKINNVLNLDCLFPKGTLNMDTLDQTFGNDKGLQKIVDDACTSAGW